MEAAKVRSELAQRGQGPASRAAQRSERRKLDLRWTWGGSLAPWELGQEATPASLGSGRVCLLGGGERFQAQSINTRSPHLCLTPADLWHPSDLLMDAVVRWDDLKEPALHCQIHGVTQNMEHMKMLHKCLWSEWGDKE